MKPILLAGVCGAVLLFLTAGCAKSSGPGNQPDQDPYKDNPVLSNPPCEIESEGS